MKCTSYQFQVIYDTAVHSLWYSQGETMVESRLNLKKKTFNLNIYKDVSQYRTYTQSILWFSTLVDRTLSSLQNSIFFNCPLIMSQELSSGLAGWAFNHEIRSPSLTFQGQEWRRSWSGWCTLSYLRRINTWKIDMKNLKSERQEFWCFK